MLAPVEAIAQSSQQLLEASNAPGLDLSESVRGDLSAVNVAARELSEFMSENLADAPFEVESSPEELDEQLKVIRHNIRNQFGGILGPCQFLLLEPPEGTSPEQVRFQGELIRGVNAIKRLSEASLERLDAFAAGTVRVGLYDDTDELGREWETADAEANAEPAHVLVVDDNPLNCEMLARFLTKLGHTSEFAVNGREALAKIEDREFDLVLLDIIMPEMNGLQVLQQLRARDVLRHLPVLVVSGLDSIREIVRCIEWGAEDFLSRPINMTLLRARVNASLEKKRLREREFSQFFPKEIARQVALNPEILDEGREADVSVLFCDIRGFSGISEKLPPAEMVRWVRDVMEVLSNCVIDHQGVLVDYIGDELVAMWGAPTAQPDHAELATRAALDMLARMPEVSARWEPLIAFATRVGIGINSGKAHVGNTGTTRRRKYGPLGNTVNLASRVQGATKYVQSSLLITGSTRAQLGDDLSARRLCTVKVNNIEQPVELFEVVSEPTAGWRELVEHYEAALATFERREFQEASAMLGDLLLEHPGDGPSLLLMSRVVEQLMGDSRHSFDPVWPLPGK